MITTIHTLDTCGGKCICLPLVSVDQPTSSWGLRAYIYIYIYIYILAWYRRRNRAISNHHDDTTATKMLFEEYHYIHVTGVLYQKQVSMAGTSNYIPQILWDVITRPCHWYLLLLQYSLSDISEGVGNLLVPLLSALWFSHSDDNGTTYSCGL